MWMQIMQIVAFSLWICWDGFAVYVRFGKWGQTGMSSSWLGQLWSVKLCTDLFSAVEEQLPKALDVIGVCQMRSSLWGYCSISCTLLCALLKAIFRGSFILKWDVGDVWAGSVVFHSFMTLEGGPFASETKLNLCMNLLCKKLPILSVDVSFVIL